MNAFFECIGVAVTVIIVPLSILTIIMALVKQAHVPLLVDFAWNRKAFKKWKKEAGKKMK